MVGFFSKFNDICLDACYWHIDFQLNDIRIKPSTPGCHLQLETRLQTDYSCSERLSIPLIAQQVSYML